jgi:hypothetical protein
MKVLVYEPNLFWSARLRKTLAALGHESELVSQAKAGDVALVNLGATELEPATLVPALMELGVYVIGHAGHKEKDLRELGRRAGCQRIASNSEMTFKLKELLEEAAP